MVSLTHLLTVRCWSWHSRTSCLFCSESSCSCLLHLVIWLGGRSMVLFQTRRHVRYSRHLRLVRPLWFLLLPAIVVHMFSVSMMVGFMSSQGVPFFSSDVSLMQSIAAIITLRTCAMWGRRLWVLVTLGTLTTVSDSKFHFASAWRRKITFGLSLYTMVSAARSIICSFLLAVLTFHPYVLKHLCGLAVNRTTTMPGCKFPPTGKFYVAWFCLTTLTEFSTYLTRWSSSPAS